MPPILMPKKYVAQTMARTVATKPLEGILVVALEQAIAAPLATLRLAQAGARVVKIERPEGDFARSYDRGAKGQSAFFLWLNRGKQSLVLNVKAKSDASLLMRMLMKADVFVQNLAPGAAERLGLGAKALLAKNPRLIVCDISGYGNQEPMRQMRAYDMLVQAESGLASVTGSAEEAGRVGVSICDIGAGMNAYSAILEALLSRERTGQGNALSISLFHSAIEWMTPVLAHQETYQKALPRTGLRHPLICPYGRFTCQDGLEILLAIQNQREWERFCVGVIECPEWATDARYTSNLERNANRDALEKDLQVIWLKTPAKEWQRRLLSHKIAYGMVNTPANLLEHPALKRVMAHTKAGPVYIPASPLHDGAAESLRVPSIDEHGLAIRREFST